MKQSTFLPFVLIVLIFSIITTPVVQLVEAVSLKKSSDIDVSIRLTENLLHADGGAVELQITNTSNERLYNVSAKLTLPQGISYAESIPIINHPLDTVYKPTKILNDSVEWDSIADLLPNESIRFHTKVSAQGEPILFIGQSVTFNVLAGVAYNPVLKNQDLEEQQLTTTIQGARMSISEGAYSWNTLVGKPTEQIITIQNNPVTDANSTKPITLTQESDDGLKIIPSEQNTIPLPDESEQKNIWKLPTLTTDQFENPLEILYSVLPQYKKDSGTIVEQNELLGVTNTLNVQYTGESQKTVDQSITNTPVFRNSYVTVRKSVDKQEINPGDVIEIKLTIETSPYYDFKPVTITDHLSDGLSLEQSNPSAVYNDVGGSKTLTWILGRLDAGTKTTISYTARVEAQYSNLENLYSADWFNDVSILTGDWNSNQDSRMGDSQEQSDTLLHTPFIETKTEVWKERTQEWVNETITQKNYPVKLKFTTRIPEKVPAEEIKMRIYMPTFLDLDLSSVKMELVQGNSDKQSIEMHEDGIPYLLVDLGRALPKTIFEIYIDGKVSSDEDVVSGTTLRTLTRVEYINSAEETQKSATQAAFIIQNPTVSIELEDGRDFAKQALISKLITVSLPDASTEASIRYHYNDIGNGTSKSSEWENWDVYDHQTKQMFDYLYTRDSDGEKEICVEVKDSLGSISDLSCDRIMLDTTAPTGSVILDNGAEFSEDTEISALITSNEPITQTESGQSLEEWFDKNPTAKKVTICHYPPGNSDNPVTIEISVNALKTHIDHHQDRIGNCDTSTEMNPVLYSYSIDGANWTDWSIMQSQSLNQIVSFANITGEVTVYVRFKDEAGNISVIYSDSIIINSEQNLPLYDITYIPLAQATIPPSGLTLENMPSYLEPEREYPLYLGVKNNGSLVWNPADISNIQAWATTHPVNISYHWIDNQSGEYYVFEGNRGFLDSQISYSESDMFIRLNIATPDKPGSYTLQIDAIHEGVTWFSTQGSSMPSFTINIGTNTMNPEPDGSVPDYDGDEFGIGQPLTAVSYTSDCIVMRDSGVELFTDILTTQSSGIFVPKSTQIKVIAIWSNTTSQKIHAQIFLSDGRSYWINDLSSLSCTAQQTSTESSIIEYIPSHVCNARYMDVFMYPRWNGPLLASLALGTSVYKIANEGDWIKIITLSGQTGWIYQTFICEGFDTAPTYDVYQELLFDRPYDSSTTIITSDFGTRNGDLHDGVDYGISCGTEIQSIADGTVLEVFTEGVIAGNESDATTPANYIKIVHENGLYQSWYWHLNAVNVIPGETVTKGQVIGLSGNTGYVRGNPEDPIDEQGCHLHFEIRSNDDRLIDLTDYFAVDPELLLQFGDLSSELLQIIAWREGNYGQLSEADYRNSMYPNLYPVYRFWNNQRQTHLYTIDEGERDNLLKLADSWTYEGPAFYAFKPITCRGSSKVYRFMNIETFKHVYSTKPLTEEAIAEAFKKGVGQTAKNFTYEGVAFCAFTETDELAEIAKPVFRFWSPTYLVHFLTIDEQEKAYIETNNANNWTYEGEIFRAIPVKDYFDWKTALESRELQAGEIIQDQGDLCGSTKLVIYKDGKHVADNVLNIFTRNFVRMVARQFTDAYYLTTLNDHCKNLGLPRAEAQSLNINGVSGQYQLFDYGAMYSSDKGTFAVFGKIKNQYDLQKGRYGFPIAAVTKQGENLCQDFEFGYLCDASEPYYLKIKVKEVQTNAKLPVGYITKECNMYMQRYNSILNSVGAIVYDPTSDKTYTLISHMWNAFNNNGGCTVFGSPTTDTQNTAGNTGEYQYFENANLYWSYSNQKSQPGIVKGEIRTYFENLGGTAHALNFPEGSQKEARSVCGAKGYHQNFTNGKIYTSPIGTMHSDWNDLLVHYAFNTGEVEGELGWPKRVPEEDNNMRSMEFEKGNLLQVRVFEEWRGIQKEVRECDPKPVCAEGEEWSDDEWRCVNSCGVGYIRKNGRCMKDFLGGSVHPLANDSTCKEADKIFSNDGGNDDFGFRAEYSDFHYGVDIRPASDVNTCKINSVSDGSVVFEGADGNGANMVDVMQGDYIIRYLHGADRLVDKAQPVNANTMIFNMGCTGRCDGRHLHFELFPTTDATYGTQLDPQLFEYFGYLGGILVDPEHGDKYLPNNGIFDWERTIYKITKIY